MRFTAFVNFEVSFIFGWEGKLHDYFFSPHLFHHRWGKASSLRVGKFLIAKTELRKCSILKLTFFYGRIFSILSNFSSFTRNCWLHCICGPKTKPEECCVGSASFENSSHLSWFDSIQYHWFVCILAGTTQISNGNLSPNSIKPFSDILLKLQRTYPLDQHIYTAINSTAETI